MGLFSRSDSRDGDSGGVDHSGPDPNKVSPSRGVRLWRLGDVESESTVPDRSNGHLMLLPSTACWELFSGEVRPLPLSS